MFVQLQEFVFFVVRGERAVSGVGAVDFALVDQVGAKFAFLRTFLDIVSDFKNSVFILEIVEYFRVHLNVKVKAFVENRMKCVVDQSGPLRAAKFLLQALVLFKHRGEHSNVKALLKDLSCHSAFLCSFNSCLHSFLLALDSRMCGVGLSFDMVVSVEVHRRASFLDGAIRKLVNLG